MNEDIMCACGKIFRGWLNKEDTCPDCLKKIIQGECSERVCDGLGTVTEGEFDNIRDVPCLCQKQY